MKKLRYIKCRKCGNGIRIPLYWIIGVEGVFYCPSCRQYHRIDYRLGALLTGLGWALALGAINIMAWFTTTVTLAVAAVAFLPLAILFSFVLRRTLLVVRPKK